ncbi:hypothetical protein ABZS54_38845, partial [Embleya sp. NPDC005575]
ALPIGPAWWRPDWSWSTRRARRRLRARRRARTSPKFSIRPSSRVRVRHVSPYGGATRTTCNGTAWTYYQAVKVLG